MLSIPRSFPAELQPIRPAICRKSGHPPLGGMHDGRMEEPKTFEVTVTLAADSTTAIQLSETDRPRDALREAAAVLERLAASIEREQEPVVCVTCGASPAGIRAAPSGTWELLPCGHGLSRL